LASQERLCSIDFVGWLVSYLIGVSNLDVNMVNMVSSVIRILFVSKLKGIFKNNYRLSFI